MAEEFAVTMNDILQAHERVKDHIHKTPVITNTSFDKLYGRNFFFKAENLQKTGSFKARGAFNAVSVLKDQDSSVKGVVTHSSGNHGQSLAWAARTAGLQCTVVIPSSSPDIKFKSVKAYGADVLTCKPTPVNRQEQCDRVARETGYVSIPPCDQPHVLAGQGTIAIEFLEQVPGLDAILVPCSGGGMVAGIAIAAKSIKPEIKIFVVEPEGKDAERSLRAGKRLWPDPPQALTTIADGIRTQQMGHMTWPIILQLAEKDVLTVGEEAIVNGTKFAFERMKTVVETAAGASIAAAMSDRLRNMDPALQNIGVILCGGNIDINHLPWYK